MNDLYMHDNSDLFKITSHTPLCIYMYVYVYMYICVYVYVYI